MRESDALTLEPGSLRHRAAAGIETAREALSRGLARVVEFLVVCGAWLLLPLWPILAAATLRDHDYLRRYWTALARARGHVRAVWRARAISRVVARRLTPSARTVPERIVGNCTHCGRCCLDQACMFLDFDDQARSRCRIYGKRVWKVLFANCSQYPLNAREIAVYRCPGFTAIHGMEPDGRHFIPIVPVIRPATPDAVGTEFSETPESPGA